MQSIARLPSLGSYSTPIEERYRHDRRAVTIADSLPWTRFQLNRAIPRISPLSSNTFSPVHPPIYTFNADNTLASALWRSLRIFGRNGSRGIV